MNKKFTLRRNGNKVLANLEKGRVYILTFSSEEMASMFFNEMYATQMDSNRKKAIFSDGKKLVKMNFDKENSSVEWPMIATLNSEEKAISFANDLISTLD